jgi:hypothetical protein
MTMDADRNKEVIREFDELGNGGGNLSVAIHQASAA